MRIYVKDHRLHYVSSFVGAEEQMIVGTADVPTGEHVILAASFEKEGLRRRARPARSLYHGDYQGRREQAQTQLGRMRSPARARRRAARGASPVDRRT